MRPLSRLLCLITTVVVIAAAEQVEVFLPGGESVVGEVMAETEDTISVRRAMNGVVGTMTYQKRQIIKVVSVGDQYQEWLGKTPQTAEAQLDLARWCLGKELRAPARAHAEKALALDPRFTEARRLMAQLGFIQIDGKWTSRDDFLATRGLVEANGRIMTTEQAAGIDGVSKERAAAQLVARQGEGRLAQIDKELAFAKARVDLFAKERPIVQAKAQELETAQKALDAAKKRAVTADERAAAAARGGNQVQGNGKRGGGGNAAVAAQELAHKDYETAQASLRKAEIAAGSAKTRLAEMDRDIPGLHAKVAELGKVRPQALTDSDAAKAKLAEVEVRLQAAMAVIQMPTGLPPELVATAK